VKHRTSLREIRELTTDIVALGGATIKVAQRLGRFAGIQPMGFD
jgi:hypothetical protein